MHSTLFLLAALQLTAIVLLAIAPFVSATPSPSQLEPHSRGVELPQGWKSLGCYSDNPTQPTLTSRFYTTPSNYMTVHICTNYCNDLKLSHAGLENGTECFCGNVLTDGATKLPNGDCLVPCTGDSSQYCGGAVSLSLYSSGAPPQASPIMPKYVNSWTLLGCFNDSDSQTLTHQVYLMGGQYANSAESCISTCGFGTLIGKFSVAGMKSAGECWCDYSMDKSKAPIDSNNCMLACPGNSLELCGGPNSTTVYAHILP